MDEAMQRRAEEMLGRLWDKHQGLIHERMQILHAAKRELCEGSLSPELRLRAAGEAHKLAGTLGTFGMQRGTDAAHEISRLLAGDRELTAGEAAQVVRWVDEIGSVLAAGRPAPATVP